MHDLFISYAREDKETAKQYALALKAQGFTVWWDRDIPAGQQFDEVIENALNNTMCLVVLWTSESISSKWVKSETAEAEDRGILVPVLVEEVKIPLAFRRIQAVNMIGWGGDTTSELFKDLVDNITRIVKQPIDITSAKPEKLQENNITTKAKERKKDQPEPTGLSALARLQSLTSNRAAQVIAVTLSLIIVVATYNLGLHQDLEENQGPHDGELSLGLNDDVLIINKALKKKGFDSLDKLEAAKQSETKSSKYLRYLNRVRGKPDQDDPQGVVRLDLENTNITDAGLVHLNILSNLSILDLRNTMITDTGLSQIQSLKHLGTLNLDGTKITDVGLKYLQSLHDLSELYLYGTNITDGGLKYLKPLIGLKTLRLGKTKITNASVPYLGSLTNLSKLSLNKTQVTEDGIKSLKRLLPYTEID